MTQVAINPVDAAAVAAGESAERQPWPLDRSQQAQVDVLYIAGIGRSGSTLLGRILGACSGHVAAGEVMRLFHRGMLRNEMCSCGEPARECKFWGRVIEEVERRVRPEDVEEIDSFCRRFALGPAMPLVFAPWKPRCVRRQLCRFRNLLYHTYRAVKNVSGAGTVVDTSKNVVWGRLLMGVTGVRVRMLHLVRDSRGVAYSFQKVRKRLGAQRGDEYMDRHHVVTSSIFWNAVNLLAEYEGARAQRYWRLRYRDFVAEPRETVLRILRDGTKGTGASVDGSAVPHVDRNSVYLSGQHILAGNPERFETGQIVLREDVEWREGMSAGRQGIVTVMTAPLLGRYGYLSDGKMG